MRPVDDCAKSESGTEFAAQLAVAEKALRARDKTIQVLLKRVQDQQDRKGSALALLAQNSELQQVVARKTAELKERADDLAQSLSVLNAMLESTGDGILVVDQQGRTINSNRKFREMWNVSGGLLDSRDGGRLIVKMLEQVKSPETFLSQLRELATQTEARSQDLIEFKDGRVFERHSQPLHLGANGMGRVWSFSDITQRNQAEAGLHQSESKFRVLVEHSLVGVYVIQNGRFSYVNPRLAEFFGYTREEIVGSCGIADLVSEEDRVLVQEHIRRRMAGEVASVHYSFRGRRKDGSKIAVEALGSQTQFDGQPAIIGTLLDITERQKSERLALRSQRLEAIGTLAGGVAHDLNNALAPILMGVEILRTRYPGESAVIDVFQTSAQRGADMVRQLLGFAKGAEGERICIQPQHLISGMQKMMNASFPKNIQLVVKCEATLPTVLGDATQLDQVLLNLCVNARDAMPHGGTLSLEARRREVDAAYAGSIPDAKPGSYVALRVRDTGTGIPPELLDRIFEPFFTTKGPDKGTGLGLSTVIGIVKGHGGFLQVYSQPGKGSTFTAYLPADPGAEAPKLAPSVVAEFRGNGETVLVVDDEPAVREIARAVLRRLNFVPLTANDGADGLIQAAQHLAALRVIITDLHMPHLDGLGFVQALRRVLPDIPIMVASGRLEDASVAEFKALGVTGRLDKPFTQSQLAQALKAALAPT